MGIRSLSLFSLDIMEIQFLFLGAAPELFGLFWWLS